MCVRGSKSVTVVDLMTRRSIPSLHIPFTRKVDELLTNSCSGVVFADSLRVRINGFPANLPSFSYLNVHFPVWIKTKG